jgi:aurora kinase
VYLILEYMEGGTLFDYMNQYEKLSETETVNFVREVTTAVKYLHDVNIAHRDIKPENIVISYGIAKLCDFGWSARVQGSRKTYCGTFDYAPPEILERKEYDLSVDLWCLGVLTYELLTGKVPFEHEERRIVMQKIVNVSCVPKIGG